ncbi:MAG: radical SAM protein [Bacteroidales bacterium]|nr:radical SAM protein [Bacteroidales bacterium]
MQIILNHLPPASSQISSAANSVLSSVLKKNGFQSKIIYWNYIFDDLLEEFFKNKGEFESLFPFYYLLAVKYQDLELISRLKINLYQQKISLRLLDEDIYNRNLSSLETVVKNKIIETLNSYIHKSEKCVFGFSFKLYQWIPALFVIDTIKEILPDSIIIFGGVDDTELADSLLHNFKTIDYIIRGEGELALLKLCNSIKNEQVVKDIEGLVFRDGELNIKNQLLHHSVYKSENYIYPDQSDLVSQYSDVDNVFLTLDTIRGCKWNQCRFCVLNKGYIYIERDPADVIQEIEFNYTQFKISKFTFTDNDIIGKNQERLDILLDLLIDLSNKYKVKFVFAAEVLHLDVSKQQIAKLAEAGFADIQIGHEALTDRLLVKMNKKTRFAHNLFFIKHALRSNISLGVNLIAGVPDESWEDLWETSQNMHFMRFYLSEKLFTQEIIPFYLYKDSPYYTKVQELDRKEYTCNKVYEYLPKDLINPKERFTYFGFHKNSDKQSVWEDISKIQQFYLNANFSYSIEKDKSNNYIYKETVNNQPYCELELDPIHIAIIKQVDLKVMSIDELFELLEAKFDDLTLVGLKEFIQDLMENYLIFADDNHKYITSVIGIDPNI